MSDQFKVEGSASALVHISRVLIYPPDTNGGHTENPYECEFDGEEMRVECGSLRFYVDLDNSFREKWVSMARDLVEKLHAWDCSGIK